MWWERVDCPICSSSKSLQAHFSPLRRSARICSRFSSQKALNTFAVSAYSDPMPSPQIVFLRCVLIIHNISKSVNMFLEKSCFPPSHTISGWLRILRFRSSSPLRLSPLICQPGHIENLVRYKQRIELLTQENQIKRRFLKKRLPE